MTGARRGARVPGRPHALFIGPDKAGSSWLHRLYAWHPRVATTVAKELFFFDRYHHRGPGWYWEHFEADDADVTVEVCHDYLFSPRAAQRVAMAVPDATYLVCLRHPLDRAISAWQYMQRQGRLRCPVEEALASTPELLDHGRYATHLGPWIRHLGAERLRVLDFASLRADPATFGRQALAAVGVDPAALDLPAEVLAPTRAAAVARWQWAATAGRRVAVAMRAGRLERPLGVLKSNARIEQALFRPTRPPQPSELDPALRAWVRDRLVDDARALDRLLGTDYAHRWWHDVEVAAPLEVAP